MCIDKQVDFCKKVTFTAIVHPIYLTKVSTYSTCDTLKEHIHMYTRDTVFSNMDPNLSHTRPVKFWSVTTKLQTSISVIHTETYNGIYLWYTLHVV